MQEPGAIGEQGTLFKPPEPKKGGALFARKEDNSQELRNITNQVENSIMRLRILEERYNNIRRRIQVNDQNMIRTNKRFTEEIKMLNSDISEMKMSLNEIKDKVILIIKELSDTPKKEEFQVLKKYIEMWEPMNFVTQQEIESIVEDIINKKLAK